MIEKLLTEEFIDIKVKVEKWEDAVVVAGNLLLNNKKIEERYIGAMIETVNEMGPYIVKAPGIAMPHGRPDCGVNDLGISVVTLENGISFGSEEFDPVKIIFSICAKDNKSHIELIQDLAFILDSDELLNNIDKCNSKGDLLYLILDIYKKNKYK